MALGRRNSQAQPQPTAAGEGEATTAYTSFDQEGPAPRGNARAAPGVYRARRPYRGFSTSICSLFQHTPEDDAASSTSTVRTDCCSMACCGILQADRTRYLLTGHRPPSLLRRLRIHAAVPLTLFMAAGYCAITVKDGYTNSFLSTLIIFVLLAYVVADCLRGTTKRRMAREELLLRMAEMERRESAGEDPGILMQTSFDSIDSSMDGDQGLSSSVGQTRFGMSCVHRLCGFARVDHGLAGAGARRGNDLCARVWSCFAGACCGSLGCWPQFCGACALAQEAREVERLVPRGRRMMDYVTFEPYLEYYRFVQVLRRDQIDPLAAHYGALSKLSASLIRLLCGAVAIMLVLSFIPRFGGFTHGDLIILVATLAQAFLILWLVHWRWHRFDLSLDAVIKYFACGFLLTTGLAISFELVEGIALQLCLLLAIRISGIQQVQENDYNGYGAASMYGGESGVASGSGFGLRRLGVLDAISSWGGAGAGGGAAGAHRFLQDDADEMAITFASEYPLITIIYLFVNAYFLAALVEELCKYFGYRMVEVPDFLSDEELEEAAKAAGLSDSDLSVVSSRLDDASKAEDQPDCTEYVSMQGEALAGAVGTAADAALSSMVSAVGVTSPRTDSQTLYPQTKSLRSKGTAITVAMVAVALGFACCENLVYIFIYNGSSLEEGESGLNSFFVY